MTMGWGTARLTSKASKGFLRVVALAYIAFDAIWVSGALQGPNVPVTCARIFGDLGPMCTSALRGHIGLFPVVICCVVFLRMGDGVADTERRDKQESSVHWSLVRALARLSGSMNLSHIFILHITSGYFIDEPVRLTLYLFFAVLIMTLIIAAGISLCVFVLVDAPANALLTGKWARTADC